MTIRFDALQLATLYPDAFGVPAPATEVERKMRARRPGVFIRQVATTEAAEARDLDDTSAARELVSGQWGLVPRWVKSASDARLRSPKLVTARSETVSTSKNFHDAWLGGQRCIVPMVAFYEDDWRSGAAVPTRITRVDGKPMGVAGLWERWAGLDGEIILSYTLLTVNANNHALLHRYQQPGSEKRMPVILNEGSYGAWLNARHEKAREFMRAYAANGLTANPVESKADKRLPVRSARVTGPAHSVPASEPVSLQEVTADRDDHPR